MSLRESLMCNKNIKMINEKLVPQSQYSGTSRFYKEKLGDRLPEHEYEILELNHMLNKIMLIDKENYEMYIKSIKKEALNSYKILLDEFKERENIISEEYKNNVAPENNFIAK